MNARSIPSTCVALFVALFVATLASSCTPEPQPTPEGVGPASNPRRPESSRQPLELARPEPAAPVLPPPAEPPPTPVPAPANPGASPDVSDLGPFEVMTWDEARARSEKQVTPENADAELEKLRTELENRP